VNAANDEWKAYLDTTTPFETDPPGVDEFSSFGIPNAGLALTVPVEAVRRSVLAMVYATQLGNVPQISGIQDILATRVIPAATRAIVHLDPVVADVDFEFEITPRMQGDDLEEPLFADHTDFLVTRGALYALRAACRAAVSYELDMPTHDESGILGALEQTNGSWLRLRGGDPQHMRAIPSDLLAAAADADAAITSLFDEIDSGDDQDDEIFKISPNLRTRSDLAEFQSDELRRITQSLTQPTRHVYDWDFDDSTPEVPLTVDLEAFFDDPIEDFKTLIPTYQLSVETVPDDLHFMIVEDEETVAVEVPESGSVDFGSCALSYSDYELQYEQCRHEQAWLAAALREVAETKAATILSRPDWGGYLYIYVLFSGKILEAGPQIIEVGTLLSYSSGRTWRSIPVVTFEADTFEEWAAQIDPTFGGLFVDPPGSVGLLQTFGYRPQIWEKVVEVDWKRIVYRTPSSPTAGSVR
jgi:hypothetical protein